MTFRSNIRGTSENQFDFGLNNTVSLRNNNGNLEFQNNGGSWKNIGVGELQENLVNATDYNSGTLNAATINAAITAISSSNKTLYLKSGTWTIDANITVPANVVLKFANGTILNIGSGKTVTINGNISGKLKKTIFLGDGNVIFANGVVDKVYSEWFGAKPDNSTDSTISVTKAYYTAYNSGASLQFLSGTYLFNLQLFSEKTDIKGKGVDNTYLKPYTTSSPLFTATYNSNWDNSNIEDLTMISSGQAGIGFQWGRVPYGANDEFIGGFNFKNVDFYNFDKALYKVYGNIGNSFTQCKFNGNNFGMYAQSNTAGQGHGTTMHNGSDRWQKVRFEANYKASMLYKGELSDVSLDDVQFELNAGFGMFITSTYGAYKPGLTVGQGYFEVNGTASTVNIDGTDYTPRDVYFNGVAHSDWYNCSICEVELVDSHINAYSSQPISGQHAIIRDAKSTFNWYNAVCDGNAFFGDSHVYSLGASVMPSPKIAVPCFRKPSVLSTENKNLVTFETFSLTNSPNYIGGADVLDGVSVNDGILFSRCMEITYDNTAGNKSSTLLARGADFTPNKVYVASIMYKCISKPAGYTYINNGWIGVGSNGGFAMNILDGGWHQALTIISKIGATTPNPAGLYLYPPAAGGKLVFRAQAFQLVEFDDYQEAIAFANSGVYCINPSIYPVEIFGDVVPNYGSWVKGSKVKSSVTAAGGTEGWICTTSGTFGTLSGVTGSLKNGTEFLSVNTFTGLEKGQFLSIPGITGIKQIIKIPANLASTTISADSASGQKVLSVASSTNFSQSEWIKIAVGTAKEETNQIMSISGNNLTLRYNLTNTHNAVDAGTVTNTIELDSNATGDAVNQAISYSTPVFKTFGSIAA